MGGVVSPASNPHAAPSAATRGLWLGLLGVLMFSATLPMTRLAVGTPEHPQLDGLFVALGRAAVAGLLSVGLLALSRAPWPTRGDWPWIAVIAAGAVFGFPLFTSVALQQVDAVHASVMVGVLPMATAAAGAWVHRQRPPAAFWVFAALGSAMVVCYALLRTGAGFALHGADALLLAAMGWGALAYAAGGKLASRLRAEHVICWALVLSLPVTLPATAWAWPKTAVSAAAWLGFAYVAVVSMWIGFFAWYRGLALGGTVRVSQVQLLQPFLSMLLATVLLGESVDALTMGFGLAVLATVLLGRRFAVKPPSSDRHDAPNEPARFTRDG